MDENMSPVFDIFPVGAGPYQDNLVSDLYFTPNARGVALCICGDPANSSAKFYLHIEILDITSGKTFTGRGVQITLNTDTLQVVSLYPSGVGDVSTIIATLPPYWRVALDVPDSAPFTVTIGAQLLI